MSIKDKISLENRGWSQMTTVLDNELPQRKRKRRPILWLFLIGLSAALVGSSIWYTSNIKIENGGQYEMSDANKSKVTLNNSGKIEAPNTVPKNLEMESKVKSNEALMSSTTTTISDIRKEESIRKEKTIQNEVQFSHENISNTKGTQASDAIVTHEVSSDLLAMKMAEAAGSSDRKLVDYPVLLQDDITEKSMKLVEKNILNLNIANKDKSGKIDPEKNIAIKNEPRGYFNFTSLSSAIQPLDFNIDEELDDSNLMIHSVQVISNLPVSRNFYGFVGGNIGTNPNGSGVQLGLGKSFELSRFNLFSEVGYGYMRFDNSDPVNEAVTVDDNEALEFDPGLGFEIPVVVNDPGRLNENEMFINVSLSSMQYVFLTGGIESKVSKDFSFATSLTVTRFLSIRNQEVNFTSPSGTFQSEIANFNVEGSTFYDRGDFNKIELSSSLGLRYRLNKRIQISANYRFGLTNLISNALNQEILPSQLDGNGLILNGSNVIRRRNIELLINYSF